MMPVKGLQPEEVTFPRLKLPATFGTYLSTIVLSMWDNIHGPTIIAVWQGDDTRAAAQEEVKDTEAAVSSSVSPVHSLETMLAVVNYSLNDEAGRIEKLDGIESKFYALLKYDIIAAAFIFAAEVSAGRPDVFSFILILPYLEMSEYLPRHSLCEAKVQKLLEDHFLAPLKSQGGKGLVREKVMKILPEFSYPLHLFTRTIFSIRYRTLPEKIEIANTFLGKDLDRRPELRQFLQQAITSHLQSSGYSVVLGEDEATVNKMILTLGLFLSPKERRISRLVCQPGEEKDGGEKNEREIRTSMFQYEPDLFLQGYVLNADNHSLLPFTKAALYQNKLPPTLIHVSRGEVRAVETKVPVFIRRKDDESERKSKKMSEMLHLKDLNSFKEVEKDLFSHTIQEFLDHLKLLPAVGGVRETYIAQFTRLLKLRALALVKYVDAEPKSTMQQAGEQIVTVLALRGAAPERPRINIATLQQDLCIDSVGDLHILLAFAEKVRPNTYLDVLGDPQLQAEAVLKEFETF